MIVKDIKIPSNDETLAGVLFTPAMPNHKAIVFLGPVAFVKEQAPTTYGMLLSKLGYTSLIFDPRYHGASTGTPRRHEDGQAKHDDICAAVDFLASEGYQDLYLVGICQGVNWVVEASISDGRIKGTALVAGHYLTREISEKYTGGADKLQERLERAKQAQWHYEATGEVDYIPITGSPEALLTAPPVHTWYSAWDHGENPAFAYKGGWENRITRMSEVGIWGYEIQNALPRLQTPLLMIHSQKAATGPEMPQKLFSLVASETKRFIWFEDQIQFQFYDDLQVIDRAVSEIDGFFRGLN